jgi:hypothetical protein
MSEAEELRKTLLQVVDDCRTTPPEKMREELIAAGWKYQHASAWSDPEGRWYLGPYGARKRMKEREAQP